MTTEYLGTGLKRVADVGLATGITAQHLAATVSAIRTSGYSVAGKGAGTYVNDALANSGLATAHPLFCKQSLDGRYWRLLPEPWIAVTQGGAVGNGSTDDYAAIQAAIDYGLSYGGATIYFPAATYKVNTSLLIAHGKGLNLRGEGPDRSIIQASGDDKPAIKTRGWWRSVVEGLRFDCNGNTVGGAFEMDGEPDGSFGVQGISFRNCMFFGNYNSKYVFTNQRVAFGSGQGSECTWIGCAFQGSGHNAGDALFYNVGTNALQNTLIGCNFQGFITGIKIGSGAIDILHCGFQSTYGYEQIEKDGWDVDGSTSGLGDTITMTGCRTESLRIYRGGGCPAQITAFAHVPGTTQPRYANTAYTLNTVVRADTAAGNTLVYRCTTAGTSGSTTPVWPESGKGSPSTVTDGSVVWTQLDFNVFHDVGGRIASGKISYGQIANYNSSAHVEDVSVTRDDCFAWDSFAGDNRAPSFRNIATGNPRRPIRLSYNERAGARNADVRQINHGNQTLVWSRPIASGTTGLFYDIAIAPAGGHHINKVDNYFGVTGGWGFAQVTSAELVTIGREGVCYYVTDGTPGSAPLTGGGTGCLAVYQNGGWQAVNLGKGLVSTDGVGKITLGASVTVPAVTLVNSANCTVTADSITSNVGAGWGVAGPYSSESYVGDVDLVATVGGTTAGVHFMLALNSDPATDSTYTSLDYAIYVYPAGPTKLVVSQNGSNVYFGPNVVDGDRIAIRRVGTTIQYLLNRTVFYTTTGVSPSTPLYLDTAFNAAGGVFEKIAFGPNAFVQQSVAIKGVIKPDKVSFVALAALTPEAGDQIFVTDGTSGSSPLTGSGSGCLAIYQNGAWRALAMGSGGGLSDGDKGDITVTSGGAVWTIDNGTVGLAKLADIATGSLLYRKSAGSGPPEVQTLATLKSDLGLTGTNSGDQTSIVGITGTKAQFNAGLTDGDFLFSGDVTPYTDEMAQDAIGAMAGTSLVYADGTPLLARAALTGAITAAQDSNATALGSFTLSQLNTALSDADVATGGGTATGSNTGDQTISLTGDISGSGTGSFDATIAADAVTNAKLANVATATIKGRASAGTGDPEDLSGTQATALLDTFTSALKGLTPASGGGTTNFLRADGTWAAPGGGGGGSPGGSAGELQYNNGGSFAGAANVEIDTGNLKLVSTTNPASPTGGITHYSRLLAGRHLPNFIAPVGIAQVLQGAMHGSSVFFAGQAQPTTAAWTVLGGAIASPVGTRTQQITIASANPWQATSRSRMQSAATAGAGAGARTAYVQWFRGNAAGFGGFFFRCQFGQSLNVNGAQCFYGLCASTAALATAAGAVSALLNMIGVGYDTTDASTGNWFLYRNDGSGTATKVDLGATDAARNTTHGYDLIIYCPPGAATEIFVRIVNLHSGATVLDTSYTTDLPAVNTGMAFKAEGNNGAVASAMNIEVAKVYIESDF